MWWNESFTVGDLQIRFTHDEIYKENDGWHEITDIYIAQYVENAEAVEFIFSSVWHGCMGERPWHVFPMTNRGTTWYRQGHRLRGW